MIVFNYDFNNNARLYIYIKEYISSIYISRDIYFDYEIYIQHLHVCVIFTYVTSIIIIYIY